MVETHRHRRYAVHRRPDPDRFTDRLMAQAIPRIQTVRRADHRAADRHDHPVPDPQVYVGASDKRKAGVKDAAG